MKAGDKVRLKSGGPLMTVVAVNQTPDGGRVIVCVWFDHDHNEKRGQYPESALEDSS
jgi:uncharacterized protein YodC (DUF2158 family)